GRLAIPWLGPSGGSSLRALVIVMAAPLRCMFFFSSRRRHTRSKRDWSSDVCSSDLAKFKKQTLEKEIDFLEKNLAVKKDEWTAYSDKVKSDLEVPAKRHMKNVEVPTGEKSMFGLGKEIMKTEK